MGHEIASPNLIGGLSCLNLHFSQPRGHHVRFRRDIGTAVEMITDLVRPSEQGPALFKVEIETSQIREVLF